MGIDLSKGERINLSKSNPGLKRVRVGLGWSANQFDTGGSYDLDASVFVCEAGPKLISDKHFIFYNNHADPEGAVKHAGDNRTGDAEGDDETVIIDLAKLHANAEEISFIVTIHGAPENGQNFGQVSNSYIKLYDDETGVEIAKYSLEDEASGATAVQFGSVYKKDGQWSFKAVGQGFKKGLGDFVSIYGGTAA